MPTITCERCGASIFALVVGQSMDVKGGNDLHRCAALAEGAEDEIGIDLVLECDEMERAIESAMAVLAADDGPIDVTWPVDTGGKRQFERWGPMTGDLVFGNHHHRCVVLDISPGGASVWSESSSDIPEGASIIFSPDGHERLAAEVSSWRSGILGLRFLLDTDQLSRTADWLMGLRQALDRG